MSDPEAEQIANQVLQPFEAFWAKLGEFEQAVKETLESDPQMGVNSLDDLKYLQRILKLRDEDIAPIFDAHGIDKLPDPVAAPPDQDDLSSEKGIDYTRLRDLLKAQDWKAADQETYRVMIRAVGKEEGDSFTSDGLLNFPCTDLKTIDSLWVKYSKGKFGFSVQKKIYVECGAKLDGSYPGDKIWEKFGDRVGWRKDGKWLSSNDLQPSLDSPSGNFPFLCAVIAPRWGRFRWYIYFLFSRTEACKL